jgi:flagellum-specific ATP synthase
MKAHRFINRLEMTQTAQPYGHVLSLSMGHIVASGPSGVLGSLCLIESAAREPREPILAEIIAVAQDSIRLVPLENNQNVEIGARVILSNWGDRVAVGDAFAGRAIDGRGRPIDGLGTVEFERAWPLEGLLGPALASVAPSVLQETGIRAIDGFLGLAKGQRLGVFAASGVGKTSLISMIGKLMDCDHVVYCLVGERAAEVDAIWSGLGVAKARTTLIAATAQESASMRIRAAKTAISLAEYWRGEGRNVLFILDSATRLALALREIGLAAGEPPTMRALTPNVFAALPRFVERCGALRDQPGAITAIMTVLAETDEMDDPVCEMMKSFLDGHILLSRRLAEQNHFPAIDIVRSVSRQTRKLMTAQHRRQLEYAHQHLARSDRARFLVESGVYKAGSNSELDQALAVERALLPILQQEQLHRTSLAQTLAMIAKVQEPSHG